MKIRNALHGIRTLKEIKERPIGFFVDLILSAIISALIPIPFVGNVVARYKNIVLWGLAGFALIGISLIMLIITLFVSPYSLFFSQPSNIDQSSITGLLNYIEDGFSDTDTPLKNPFGGNGMINVIITANFHDLEKFIWNGKSITKREQGIDIVPNSLYFLTNKAAKLTGEPIIFNTLTGKARTYTDQNGALTIEVTNSDETIKTIYVHLQQILIGNNTLVHPGQPIGVMGSTGMSTGPHLEYQVRLNKGGSWVAVNPKDYIQ